MDRDYKTDIFRTFKSNENMIAKSPHICKSPPINKTEL
jgi:hypothetical protein